MHNHITKVEHKPAFARLSLHAAFFLVILPGFLQHALGKRVEHTVAGAAAYDKIIGKRRNILDIEKQYVFALFVLQGFDDFMGKF
jgi:hypothetical protein